MNFVKGLKPLDGALDPIFPIFVDFTDFLYD